MKCRYSITFEFETIAPLTTTGTVTASSLRTISARAIDDAISKNPGLNWTSIVIVLERKDS